MNRNMKDQDLIFLFLVFLFLAITGLFFQVETPSAARNVIDQLGRQITLPDDPKRIISLAPSITEIIFALEQNHRLQGATRYSDFPLAAKRLPRVGTYVHLDLERIVALNPDLCIATKDGNPKDVVYRIASFNIPVYVVDPRNTAAVIETILEIGKLVNASERAKSLAKNMRSRIERVKAVAARAAYRPRVFFQIGISPIVSVGTRTFTHEFIELAGGKNLAKGPVAYPRFSREQLLALSPEVIIVSSMAGTEAIDRARAQWSRWPDVPAVQNKCLFFVDSNLFDRPTPRMVDALELLVRMIHPELFEENR